MTANEDQQRLARQRAAREMLAADVYAGALTNTFRGTRHEAEAVRLARLVADSAVDAAILRRGAHRSPSATRAADEARQVARLERQRADEAVERWFAETHSAG
ncbi:hypothetical protein [Lentzea sp. NPDC059081]|uniref:hypothetical protein n=1 Tax=Lentzea sp. NPDC059081 TaxID=3346719 RepID=UPI0036763834